MPSIRLMGFAAGALFLLSSAGNAQSLQAPGKAMPTGQAPSKVLPHPQGPGKGLPAAYGDAGYTYAGRLPTAAGTPAARPAIPAGTTSAGPAPTRAASAGRGPGWGCGPAWASAASARGADRPQALRSPRGGSAGPDLRADSGWCRRRPVRPGVTPVATRPFGQAVRTGGGGRSNRRPLIRRRIPSGASHPADATPPFPTAFPEDRRPAQFRGG